MSKVFFTGLFNRIVPRQFVKGTKTISDIVDILTLNDEECYIEIVYPIDGELFRFPLSILTDEELPSGDFEVVVERSTFTNAAQELPEGVEVFWNALPMVELQNDVLQLPNGVYWLGDADYGATIMVRKVYQQLLDAADTHQYRKLVVRGIPGIGKSWWLLFLLWKAAREGTTVVLQHASLNCRFLFSPCGRVLVGDRETSFRMYLKDPKAWYLVDGQSPTRVFARTFAAVSPKKQHYYEYSKFRSVAVLYMPAWTLDELLVARKLMYPHLTEDLVTELFMKWGGVARYCLELATDEERQAQLRVAILQTDLAMLLRAVGSLETADDASHLIFHWQVSSNLRKATVDFASDHVAREVVHQMPEDARQELQRELAACREVREKASFAGHAHRAIFHIQMKNGARFMCRDLDHPEKPPFPVRFGKVLRVHVFKDDQGVLTAKDADYFIPVSKVFPAVDSLLPKACSVFQATVAEKHPVSSSSLSDALELLPPTKSQQYSLFFAVPAYRFDRFTKQTIHNANGLPLQRPSGRLAQVRQFALKVVCMHHVRCIGW